MIARKKDIAQVKKLQSIFPVTALLGARQTGKTTLANQLTAQHYFDLENPVDVTALENPAISLGKLNGTIVIDEIQRKPDLFPVLKYLIDSNTEQKYIIPGSFHIVQLYSYAGVE